MTQQDFNNSLTFIQSVLNNDLVPALNTLQISGTVATDTMNSIIAHENTIITDLNNLITALPTLKGDQGLQGIQGLKGDAGLAGTNAYSPIGSVIYMCANTIPSGYLKANGALISRLAYPALFGVIGTSFGVGDGSTTFALPDLRGQFVRGFDDGKGLDVSRSFGSFQSDSFKSHSHAFPYGPNSGGGVYALNSTYNAIPLTGYTGATQVSGGTETRPVNIALLALIKY